MMTTSPSLKKPLALPRKCSKTFIIRWQSLRERSLLPYSVLWLYSVTSILKLRTHFHCKVDTIVNIFCPHIIGGLGIEDGEDSTVQVSLPSCLGITSHGEDGGAGPVPGNQVGRPANTWTQLSTNVHQLHSELRDHFNRSVVIIEWNELLYMHQFYGKN